MTSLLSLALAPTFFVMLLGYVAGRTGSVSNLHVAELNTVVMSYALPAALFVATASTEWSALTAQWPVVVSLAVVMMGTYLLWYGYERWVRGQDSAEGALQSLAVGQPNYAAAAFPVITALFGADHLSTVALGIAVGTLLPSPLTLALLELAQSKPGSRPYASYYRRRNARICGAQIATAAGHALTKPIVLAPVFGTLISMTGWSLPNVTIASLREIGSAAGGMALFVTGLVLSQRGFRLTGNTLLGVAVANIVQPVLTFLICAGLGASAEITKLSVVMAALPSGFFGILFGTSYDRISDEANSTIIASTIFSVATLAVTIGWIYWYGG